MRDLTDWLTEIGLSQYAQVFADQDIDIDILDALTDADLRELGLSLGHRRKLQRALERRERDRAADAPIEPPRRQPPEGGAERRQLTVLFCDLVGSTALGARLDPEDLAEVMRSYQETCAAAIARWDGEVAKYMGDGVLAYFGFPQAHEDDPERAARAGLQMVAAVAELSVDGIPLAARVGIATGVVLVGELIGAGASAERTVVGDTPNLAARLQGLAAAGEVMVAPTTRSLIGALFQLEDRGRHALKGIAAPVNVHRVVSERAVVSRFAAHRSGDLGALVGRGRELDQLDQLWQRATAGQGQVALIAGEAGIGKSHLVEALDAQLSGTAPESHRYQCSPFHANSPLHPVIEQLKQAAGIPTGAPPAVIRAKLGAYLVGVAPERAELIGALLVPTGANAGQPGDPDPGRRKQRTLDALIDRLATRAANRSLLMVVEDLQWSDPSTLELLERLVTRIGDLRLLLILTFRPEFEPPWTGRDPVTLLNLTRLTPKDSAAIVARVCGAALPEEVVEQILARTEGVPLFVEELTKTVLESEALEVAGDRYRLSGPLAQLAIPSSLHDSLMARLDRDPGAKEVAQIGAVLGRTFDLELLAALTPLARTELDDALTQLEAAELIIRPETEPDAGYRFRHALVRDTAYQSLLRARRRELHGQVVELLEHRSAEIAGSGPEVLAHHCAEAGQADQAIAYLQLAGNLAAGRSANAEAEALLKRALALLAARPEGEWRDRLELDLLADLGAVLLTTHGQAAPDVRATYERARDLREGLGDTRQLGTILQGLQILHMFRGDLAAATATGEKLLRLAETSGMDADRIEAHRALGIAAFHQGELTAARSHLATGLSLYHPDRHRSQALRYQEDPGLSCGVHAALTLWFCGYPDQARAGMKAALLSAQTTTATRTRADGLAAQAQLSMLLREVDRTRAHAEAILALTSPTEFPLTCAEGLIARGWSRAHGDGLPDEIAAGIADVRAGIALADKIGVRLTRPRHLAILSTCLVRAGAIGPAVTCLEQGLADTHETGGHLMTPTLHRLRGELLDAAGDPGGAEAALSLGLEMAKGQGAKAEELRGATALARLWQHQGKVRAAKNQLAPVYAWFTEGFDTVDLENARTLLDELG